MGFDIRHAVFESQLAYSLSDLGQVSVFSYVKKGNKSCLKGLLLGLSEGTQVNHEQSEALWRGPVNACESGELGRRGHCGLACPSLCLHHLLLNTSGFSTKFL